VRYRVGAIVTISVSTVVEAETEAQALEIARGRDMGQIIDQSFEDEVWKTSGEIDGDPCDLYVEEEPA
jgi:hypothetical protein